MQDQTLGVNRELPASAKAKCQGCRDGEALGFEFTMAFHPIFDTKAGRPWGYEALVRGPGGEGAGTVLGQLNDDNLYRFDQAARVKAIELAGDEFVALPRTDGPTSYDQVIIIPFE